MIDPTGGVGIVFTIEPTVVLNIPVVPDVLFIINSSDTELVVVKV